MENEDFDSLLQDAVQSGDGPRRDRAIRQLLAFAERVAAARNPAHAESVAASAVGSLHQKLELGSVAFESPAQLLAFLRRVATGKAIDRIRNDARHLGPRADGGPAGNSGEIAGPVAADDRPSTMVDKHELKHFVHQWLSRFPRQMHVALADHIASTMAQVDPDDRLRVLGSLEKELEEIAESIRRVLSLFPEVLQDRAAKRIAEAEYRDLPAVLLRTEGMLLGARELQPNHRLAIEMREAGWSPTEVAEKLGMTAGNVRVIHHRLSERIVRQP